MMTGKAPGSAFFVYGYLARFMSCTILRRSKSIIFFIYRTILGNVFSVGMKDLSKKLLHAFKMALDVLGAFRGACVAGFKAWKSI